MRMKIALVGIGKIARDQHVPAIAASGDWELAASVSRHAAVDGVSSYDDFAVMLRERADIPVISLCLPPAPRFEYAAAAIRAGRHVMLEKPPGATVAECLELEALARAAGVSIYATWHSREAAAVASARAWLKGKRVKRLHITWKEDVRRWHPGQTWIWRAGGLGVFDPGINALSILTEVLPDPVHLTCADLFFPQNCDTPIAAHLAFFHPHGGEVAAEFDWRHEGEQTWTIAIDTDGGTMALTDGGAKLAIDGVAQSIPPETAGALGGEYPRLYAKMAALVRSSGVDMDLSPMIHVADAFLLGRRHVVDAFVD